jgi:hypothetical protein
VSYGAPIHGLGPNGEPMAPRAIGGLNELAAAVHLTAMKKGWWGDIRDYLPDTEESPAGPSMRGHGRNFTEVLALIHSEVSETLEEYRSGSLMDQVLWEHKDGTRCIGTTPCVEDNNAKPVGIPIEMADILIRVPRCLCRLGDRHRHGAPDQGCLQRVPPAPPRRQTRMIKELTPIVLIGAALLMGGCIQELPDGKITDKFTRAEGANARNGVCKPGAKCETVYNLCTSKCEDVAKTDYDTFQVGQMFSQDAYNAGHGRSGTKNNQDPEAWPVVFEAANDDYSNKPFVVHVQYKCVPRMPNLSRRLGGLHQDRERLRRLG